MNKGINVLLTAIGCPGGPSLIQGLREDPSIRIVGTDTRETIVAKFLVDKFYQVPPGRHADYINVMLEIVEREKIDVVLPMATFELDALSGHKRFFQEKGCEVCVSDVGGQVIANNRYLMSKRFEGKSFIADFESASNWPDMQEKIRKLGFPDKRVVVKPFVSHGSIGLRIIDNAVDLYTQYRQDKPYSTIISLSMLEQIFKDREFDDILLQEYLPGREWEVDLLLHPVTHKVIGASARDENEVILSSASKVVLVNTPEILDIGKQMAEELKLSYAINLSVKLAEDGTPKVTEMNPRLGAANFLAISGGMNLPLFSVYLALGREVVMPDLKWGLTLYTYRGFLIMDNERIVNQTRG